MSEATFILTNYYVAYLDDQEMWGVFSAFHMPIRPVSEWYTEEDAINAAKIEEAVWEAKRQN